MTENEKRDALSALYAAERERICGLSKTSEYTGDYDNPVFGQGSVSPRLMFVGEAPGSEEAKAGMPFVGKAGKQLDELLIQAGIERGETFVTNAVKFRPTKRKTRTVSNRTPNTAETAAGMPLLREEIQIIQPGIIATLGNTPLKAVMSVLSQKFATIGEVHGSVLEFQLDGRPVRVFPLYHPASCIYNRALKGTLEADMQRLNELLLGEGEM